MNIGLVTNLKKSVWGSGVFQNAFFLYDALEKAGFNCRFLSLERPEKRIPREYKMTSLAKGMNGEYDLVIMIGEPLKESEIKRFFKQNSRCKIVLLQLLNKYNEHVFHSLHKSQTLPEEVSCLTHEIWTSPHYAQFIPYLENIYGCDIPVKICPYIWDSRFLSEEVSKLGKKEVTPRFKPENQKRICILEPNVNISKACLLPLLTCEKLYREDPSMIDCVSIFCASTIKGNSYFINLIKNFSLVKDDRVFFNRRWNTPYALGTFGGTIVSHQNLNDLNYVYLEALHLGVPLIHNSELLSDQGYYYPEFDVDAAAKALQDSILNHSTNTEVHWGRATHAFHKFSVFNELNVTKYKQLVEDLCNE